MNDYRKLDFDTHPGVVKNRLKPRRRLRRALPLAVLGVTGLFAAGGAIFHWQNQEESGPSSVPLRTAKLDGLIKQQRVFWEELRDSLELRFQRTPKLDQRTYWMFSREVFRPTEMVDTLDPEAGREVYSESSSEIREMASRLLEDPSRSARQSSIADRARPFGQGHHTLPPNSQGTESIATSDRLASRQATAPPSMTETLERLPGAMAGSSEAALPRTSSSEPPPAGPRVISPVEPTEPVGQGARAPLQPNGNSVLEIDSANPISSNPANTPPQRPIRPIVPNPSSPASPAPGSAPPLISDPPPSAPPPVSPAPGNPFSPIPPANVPPVVLPPAVVSPSGPADPPSSPSAGENGPEASPNQGGSPPPFVPGIPPAPRR